MKSHHPQSCNLDSLTTCFLHRHEPPRASPCFTEIWWFQIALYFDQPTGSQRIWGCLKNLEACSIPRSKTLLFPQSETAIKSGKRQKPNGNSMSRAFISRVASGGVAPSVSPSFAHLQDTLGTENATLRVRCRCHASCTAWLVDAAVPERSTKIRKCIHACSQVLHLSSQTGNAVLTRVSFVLQRTQKSIALPHETH
jgi:hypothetical protein